MNATPLPSQGILTSLHQPGWIRPRLFRNDISHLCGGIQQLFNGAEANATKHIGREVKKNSVFHWICRENRDMQSVNIRDSVLQSLVRQNSLWNLARPLGLTPVKSVVWSLPAVCSGTLFNSLLTFTRKIKSPLFKILLSWTWNHFLYNPMTFCHCVSLFYTVYFFTGAKLHGQNLE